MSSERWGLGPVEIDRNAARRATKLAAVVLCLVMAVQVVIVAVFTLGPHPLQSVTEVPAEPDAQAWDGAPSETLSLDRQQMTTPYGGGSVDNVTVQAVTNDTHVAFRLEWEDPTADTEIDEPDAYSDAAAIMLRSGSKPPVTMGANGEPVNIWYWRSSWQHSDADPGGDMYAYPHPDAETKPGEAAENPVSQSTNAQYGQNYYATGFGSLTNAETQPVAANGQRTDDGWAVVFQREHETAGDYDAVFEDGEQMYLTYAIWNGSADEANGEKSLSYQFLTLDPGDGTLSETDSADDEGANETDTNDSGVVASATTSARWAARAATNWPAAIILATGAAWLISYWRIRE
ncbi:ethylbenzene dehydrogenase-related protein [Natrialba taiwanensis]|uniref:ethylbenzene dehydrogenase-related protein n=1 Tax=Natrialba taiwanensis TaxID=160846 RepID=UPI00067829B3|nr:ethylbenzene dehydrogenase-related protein [Natrialba taiwanensis]